MTKQQQKEAARNQAIASLREMFSQGDKVHVTINSVARSGMSRTMSLYKLTEGDAQCINHLVANLGVYNTNKHGNLRVPGCGMDMTSKAVYDLSHALFGDGYALKRVNF